MHECEHADADNKVFDSRPTTFAGFPAIRRRRKCLSCGFRWTTFELTGSALEELREAGERLLRTDAMLSKIAALAAPSPKTAE